MARGLLYSPEENAAILAGPPREPPEQTQARLVALGFAERTVDAIKTQKKKLRQSPDLSGRHSGKRTLAEVAQRHMRAEAEVIDLRQRLASAEQRLAEAKRDLVGAALTDGTGIISEEVERAVREFLAEQDA